MDTRPVTRERLRASVVAVPPLARRPDLSLNPEANRTLIRHLEAGGVTTLLYGGNANFYNISLHGYAELLGFLAEAAGPDTLVIPSVGPAYGTMMAQLEALRDTDFPTVMVLPPSFAATQAGFAGGIRRFAEAWGRPVVLYLKREDVLTIDAVRRLVGDGLVLWVKYAVVRDDPSDDAFLRRLLDVVDRHLVVSGIGEQPALEHVRDFGLAGFTSGCVCLAPRLSMRMLRAMQDGDWARAEVFRRIFRPLEDLRNAVSPVRVLHDAVTLSGLAAMGPILPHFTNLDAGDRAAVAEAARELLVADTRPGAS